MKFKLLSVAAAIGCTFACYQHNPQLSVDAWHWMIDSTPKSNVVPVDRSDLSRKTLPADWDERENASDPLDLKITAKKGTEGEPTIDMAVDAGDEFAKSGPWKRERLSQPTGYQKKLADQRAWASQHRPVQLAVAASQPAAPPQTSPKPTLDSKPIVPGMADPHQWYQQSINVAEKEKGSTKIKPNNPLAKLTQAIEAAESDYRQKQGVAVSVLTSPPEINAANSQFFQPQNGSLTATPLPSNGFINGSRAVLPLTRPQRTAQSWETGRY